MMALKRFRFATTLSQLSGIGRTAPDVVDFHKRLNELP
jgi:hypothetical protein